MRRPGRWLLFSGVVLALLAWAAWIGTDEFQTSRRQASHLTKLAAKLGYRLEPGRSDAIKFPGDGPYDQRLGYSQLPHFIDRLGAQGYGVTAQTRMSPDLLDLRERGYFAPYHEKDQAGLTIADCRGEPLYAAGYPQRVYDGFASVPPLLTNALLFIENRELLDEQHPMRNPAVEWDRFTKAALDQARHVVDSSHRAPGGSTLATQIEKYRHSPEGRTESGHEKLRQMASASIRAYMDGEDTRAWRRHLVAAYLDTVPLSAQPGFGEVNGLGDGLWAWYGRDFAEVNRLLSAPIGAAAIPTDLLPQQALAFKQALSLMIAQRRPSHYLGEESDLEALTDSYLRVMADAGVIPPALRDAALPLPLKLQQMPPDVTNANAFIEHKAATAVRARLQSMLDVPRAYDLDRIDLAARSTLDGDVQRAATQLLRGLREPAGARAAGLYGYRLLTDGDDTSKIVFSFTLFERTPTANLLRVQTDNVDQPFDLNDGARLDLGSTAKLRTMVTYLDMVAELHAKWSGLDAIALAAEEVQPKDMLAIWAKDYLLHADDKGLKTMLLAAMERTYSGNTGETFYTGGGAHHFVNFEKEEDSQRFTVREALKHSVNLAFIRIMRDVVYHVMSQSANAKAVMFDDVDDPGRREYLARFADKEGREYLQRFYRRYVGKTALQSEDILLQSHRATPARLAATFFGLEPEGDAQDLADFLSRHLPAAGPNALKLSDAQVAALFDKYGPERWSLADRGYIAGVHPLDLWVVGYLRHHPQATFNEAATASVDQRQEVYAWLFKTRHKGAQDVRIRNLIEQEAFANIDKRWRKLGYPFDNLTPSYATALGASGDRPAALAELMGILVNHGLKLPTQRVDTMDFARGTPYETRLAPVAGHPERLLPAEVADVAIEALRGVVDGGTAVRMKDAFTTADGQPVPVGGKTGTGDHRFDTYGPGGRLISSRVVNRTASFVFYIGDRYFGTMVAYVHEPYAANYKFTSAMPAQMLKALVPVLRPLVQGGSACKAGVS